MFSEPFCFTNFLAELFTFSSESQDDKATDAKLPDEIEVAKPETPAEVTEEKGEEVEIETSKAKTADTKEEAVEEKEPKEAKTDDKKEGEKK